MKIIQRSYRYIPFCNREGYLDGSLINFNISDNPILKDLIVSLMKVFIYVLLNYTITKTTERLGLLKYDSCVSYIDVKTVTEHLSTLRMRL